MGRVNNRRGFVGFPVIILDRFALLFVYWTFLCLLFLWSFRFYALAVCIFKVVPYTIIYEICLSIKQKISKLPQLVIHTACHSHMKMSHRSTKLCQIRTVLSDYAGNQCFFHMQILNFLFMFFIILYCFFLFPML